MPRIFQSEVRNFYIGDGNVYVGQKKPRFKKSEMRGDLPFKKGTVVSASEKGGAINNG